MDNSKNKDCFNHFAVRTDYNATQLVDHTKQMTAHPHAHDEDVNEYHRDHEAGDLEYKSIHLGGVSPKSIFTSPTGTKWMVKPYHEGVRTTDYDRFPIRGWSEIAFQGLMHRAGIGHMCQQVHVTEHDTPHAQSHPMLAVKLDKDAKEWGEVPNYEDFKTDHRMRDQAAMLGFMDFLTNQTDRHQDNLMAKVHPANHEPVALFAVDNARAFQYRASLTGSQDEDNLERYFHNKSLAAFDAWRAPHLAHAAKWWKTVSHAVRDEMYDHLRAIKHPDVYDFVKRQFDKRAAALDNFSRAYDPAKPVENYLAHNPDGRHAMVRFEQFIPKVRPGKPLDENGNMLIPRR